MKHVLRDCHIFRLTDDTGMLQHSKYSVPDPRYGYTTDDNARALIMALMLYERYGEMKYLDLVYRYTAFLLNARTDSGRFRNFMGYDRKWLEDEGSEDCFGRCLWAIGFALSGKHTPEGVKNCLSYLLRGAKPSIEAIESARGKAYSILGLTLSGGEDERRLAVHMAESLCDQYDACSRGDWKWFEDKLTYSNYVLPWSLLAAYRVSGLQKFRRVGLESMEFLESVMFRNGYFKPVGCKGWFPRDGKPAEFDEQPVEACEAVLAYADLYEITGDKKYLEKARTCHEWYLGKNSMGVSLVDGETGGCFDGITPDGPNLNMGAESLVAYVISSMRISDYDT